MTIFVCINNVVMFNSRFTSLSDLRAAFPTEQSCIAYLEDRRWKGNVRSPFDSTSKVYKCKDNKYRCKNTGKYFDVKTKTILQGTRIPLIKWFESIWCVLSYKKGISSIQMSKNIDVAQKTAWFMMHRIRKALGIDNSAGKNEDGNEGKLSGSVEIDESFIGGKNKNRHRDKKVRHNQGRAFKDKTPVFGLIQQGGRIIAKVVPDTKVASLFPLIQQYVEEGSYLYTDEWNYGEAANRLYIHLNVNHSLGFYGKGEFTTNHIENFWSIVKRGVTGVYHFWSRRHMQRYIDEFVYRANNRRLSNREKFDRLLENMEYRLTYKELVYG